MSARSSANRAPVPRARCRGARRAHSVRVDTAIGRTITQLTLQLDQARRPSRSLVAHAPVNHMAPNALSPASGALLCGLRDAFGRAAACSPIPGSSRRPVLTIALPARSRRVTTVDRAGACRVMGRRSPSTPSGPPAADRHPLRRHRYASKAPRSAITIAVTAAGCASEGQGIERSRCRWSGARTDTRSPARRGVRLS